MNVIESANRHEKNGGETLRASVHDTANGRENRRWKCQQREQRRGRLLSSDPPQREWRGGERGSAQTAKGGRLGNGKIFYLKLSLRAHLCSADILLEFGLIAIKIGEHRRYR